MVSSDLPSALSQMSLQSSWPPSSLRINISKEETFLYPQFHTIAPSLRISLFPFLKDTDKIHPQTRIRRLHKSTDMTPHNDVPDLVFEDYRIGGPIMCDLNTKRARENNEATKIWDKEGGRLSAEIHILLREKHNLRVVRSATLDIRKSRFNGSKGVTVLRVGVERENYETIWPQAIGTLQRYLYENNLGDINIEVYDPRCYEGKLSYCRSARGLASYQEWERIKPKVREIIDKVQCIEFSCEDMGISNELNFPVIVVGIHVLSTRDWRVGTDEIGELLDREGLEGMGVWIYRTQIWPECYNPPCRE